MTGTVDKAQRDALFERDHYRCVVCGTGVGLTYGHRVTVGMGGSSLVIPLSGGVTQCARHNQAADAEGQRDALYFGWKLRSAAKALDFLVPFFDFGTGLYWMPDLNGGRFPMADTDARARIYAVNELTEQRLPVGRPRRT